ncbi:MAG: 23S rRNA (guanosine(2251)-2'-O)-methyltransferase RlmB [Clostridiales bacterium]|nr:23S rRNA (guanosine(2251)-2'-O)-methyltransferase RlmB [Clostridiales bacterium]
MIVDGINVVRELLNADCWIDKIVAEDNGNRDILSLVDRARAKGIKVEVLSKVDYDKRVKTKNQGIMAYVPNFKYCEVKDILLEAKRREEKPFIVILDGISDPHNLGAIIRTSECAGVHGVIIPGNRACEVTDTVYRTSAGAVTHMKVAMVTNLTRTIKELKEQGVWIYALEAGNKKLYKADFTYPTALVIGSEGKGVSRLVRENVDEVLSLDMFGKVNSLNASNAGAIAIYEVVRQRSR